MKKKKKNNYSGIEDYLFSANNGELNPIILRQRCVELLGGKCEKCGNNKEYLLEFHHVYPKKKKTTISRLIKKMEVKSLCNEVQKCILLCSNCHREYHWLKKQEELSMENYLKEER